MTTVEVLRAVAAHGLDRCPRAPIPIRPAEVDTLLILATTHRLIGLLDQGVADGALRCDKEAEQRIGARAVEVAARSVRLERHLLFLDDVFVEHGIDHRFIKGSTIAHRFYSHPGLRMSVDVDVLVPGERLESALAVLGGTGHARVQADPYPGFSRRYAKSVTMRHHTGVEVDVHRVIPDGPFGLRAHPDVIWARPTAVVCIGGRDLSTLDPVGAFVHACVNAVASYDMVTLASLRDVAQVGAAVADQIPEAQDLARALGVSACLTEAVRLATGEMRWDPPASIKAISQWPVSGRERQWLDSYRIPPSDRRRVVLGLQAVPGVLPKVAYLGSVAALLVGRPSRRRARTGRSARGSSGPPG